MARVSGGEPPAPELRGSVAGDGAVACGVLLLGLIELATTFDPSLHAVDGFLHGVPAIVAGALTASAQAATAWLRRRWPRRMYAVLALVGVVQFASIGVLPSYAWAVLAYSVARAPGRAAGWLAAPALAAAVTSAFVVPSLPGGWSDRVWEASALGLVLALYVLAGAIPGRLTRAAAERTERERDARDRARRASALAGERARISQEIGSGVLTGLRRLARHCARIGAAVDPMTGETSTDGEIVESDLRLLAQEARATLVSMRRVLVVLRGDGELEPPISANRSHPGEASVAGSRGLRHRGARWRPPLPDRVGLATSVLLVTPAVLLSAGPPVRRGLPGRRRWTRCWRWFRYRWARRSRRWPSRCSSPPSPGGAPRRCPRWSPGPVVRFSPTR